MNYSEFRMMTTALEKYYKDVKIAILTGKRQAKDLDMRYMRIYILNWQSSFHKETTLVAYYSGHL